MSLADLVFIPYSCAGSLEVPTCGPQPPPSFCLRTDTPPFLPSIPYPTMWSKTLSPHFSLTPLSLEEGSLTSLSGFLAP
jgi:hypothetical protein